MKYTIPVEVSHLLNHEHVRTGGERRIWEGHANAVCIVRTRKESRFEHADQKSQHDDGGIIVYPGEPDGQGPPSQQQDAQPQRRSDVMFHDPVRGYLEDGIGQGEQSHGDGVVTCAHGGLLEEVVSRLAVEDFGVADVASVEEVEEVDPTAQREDADVESTVEFSIPLLEFELGILITVEAR